MRNTPTDLEHGSKTHYIPEWAEHRNLTKADIARGTGADRSLVTRWFGGMIPSERYLQPLADMMQTEVAGLFRHPDDDWLARMFRDKTEEQKEAAIQMLKLFFRDSLNTEAPSGRSSKVTK